MNAWFPRLNVRGDIASGISGIWLTPADGSALRQVSPVGTGPVWAGDVLVYNRGDGTTQVGGSVLPVAYNDYRGSDDGRWAGFMPGAGGRGLVDLYNGAELIQSEPTACAPRFASDRFAYLRPYQSEERVLYVNGTVIASGRINDVVLQRNGAFTVWQLATGTYTRSLASDRPIVTIRNDEAPIAAFLAPDGSPWIVTNTGLAGGVMFVRPLDSPMGYILRGILMYPDTQMVGHWLRVVASGDDGSPRFDNWIDFSAPRVDLRLIAGAPSSDPPVPPSPQPSPKPVPVPVPVPVPKPKPVTPHEEISMAVTQVAGVIHYTSKKPSAQAGCTNYILPDGQVFSAVDDGNHGQPAGTVGSSRPAGSDGPWEQGQESGAIATFNANGYYTFLLAPVDRLAS